MESKDYLMLLAAIAAAVIAGYVIYNFGMGFLKEGGHGEKGPDPYALLANATAKPAKYANYTYSFADNYDGYVITTRMVRAGDAGVLSVKSPIFDKTIYETGQARVLCITFDQQRKCSDVQNSTLEPTFAQMAGTFIGSSAQPAQRALQVLYSSGALNFSAPENSSVNGTGCELVTYTLDYGKVSLAALEQLGMNPNDPALFYSRDYVFQYCIDSEYNVLSIALNYTFMGEKRSTKTAILESAWGSADASELALPAQLQNTSDTENLFLDAISAEKSVLACSKNASTKDICIKDYAVMNKEPDVCLLAGADKDKCIVTVAPQKLRSDLCEKTDSPDFRDDCWVEMAIKAKNSSFCTSVANSSKKDLCISLSTVCKSDSDCATAGCSGQLCVPAGLKGTVTTCEMRPEYSCLQYSSCGCNNGVCGWNGTENYTKCLQNASAGS